MIDEPTHQPYAPEAPIPGVHFYSGCSDDHPTVRPDGTCRGCGQHACPVCGRELLGGELGEQCVGDHDE